jgi:hypothetical protein
MARRGNPISVRLDLNRSSDSSRFSEVRGKFTKLFIPVLLLISILLFVYILSLSIGGLSFFWYFLSKVGGFLGVKALSFILVQMGCPATLAFVIGCGCRALVTPEASPSLAHWVLPSGREILHSNSGSGGPSHSNSWTEDSFGIQVLMEPFSETEMEGTSARASIPRVDEAGPPPLLHNSSLESSMRNRIARLEGDSSPYLLDKAKGQYWGDIKVELDKAPSQREYNRLLDFENRDLHIREKKTESFRLFKAVLERNPTLADQAPYNPQEAFHDFLGQATDTLDKNHMWERDRLELDFLDRVIRGLKKNGASYVTEIFQEKLV